MNNNSRTASGYNDYQQREKNKEIEDNYHQTNKTSNIKKPHSFGLNEEKRYDRSEVK